MSSKLLVLAASIALIINGAGRAQRAPPSRPPRHVALLIGIGDYRYFAPNGPPGNSDLSGPPRDVELMRFTLRGWGFDGADVRTIEDSDASQDGIAAGFRWVAERATDSSDVVVIFYSGHGSSARDVNGDESRVTPGDTADEGLVPWDAQDIHEPTQLVLDDQIGEWLAKIPSANVTIIVDACYSGTATRGREVSPLARAKGPVGNAGGEPVDRQLLVNPAYTLITAASATQVAWELPLGERKEEFGALTYFLTRAFQGANRRTTRYDEVMQQVRSDLRGAGAIQTPQLEGDRGALLFRVRGDVPQRSFVVVTPATSGAGRFALDVGAVQGVRVSAVYDVYPPAELEFAGRPIAQIVVDSVGETQSFGTALAGGKPIPSAARATLARLPRQAKALQKITVFVSQSAQRARAAVESLPFVSIGDSIGADAWVSGASGALEVLVDGAPLPALLPDDYPAEWVDGRGYVNSSAALCQPLRRAFAAAAFKLVQHPAPPYGLELELQLVETGSNQPSGPPTALDTVYIGRSYDLFARVRAPATSTLYLSAAVVGYLGLPTVLYPEGNVSNKPFPLNIWVPIFPGLRPTEPGGVEVVKVIANSDQYDFRSLVGGLNRLCSKPNDLRRDPPTARMWSREPRPVNGWLARDYAVVILPAPR